MVNNKQSSVGAATPSHSPQPSGAAYKAAQSLINAGYISPAPVSLKHVAEIIDRESGLPELLKELKSMLHIFDRGLAKGTIGRMVCDDALKAIAKVEPTNDSTSA